MTWLAQLQSQGNRQADSLYSEVHKNTYVLIDTIELSEKL